MEPSSSPCSSQNRVFNDQEADVILQSSDNVDFRTYKLLLSLASPMFQGMFALPPASQATKDNLPLVEMAEDSATIEKLLMFCHPGHAPMLDDLDEIKSVLAFATKYGMTGIEERASRHLDRFIHSEPLRVYCIAWNFRLEEQARLAARRLLASPILPRSRVKELNHVPATALHRLEEYHCKCQQAAKAVASGYGSWINREALIRFDAGDTCWICTNGGETVLVQNDEEISARSWWTGYMQAAAVSLQERPCGATVKDYDLLNKAFKRAANCSTCRESVFAEMTEFCDLFAREVDKATDLIVLKLEEL